MNEMNDAFALNDENLKHFESTGKIVCKYCNGSGINPTYKEIDKILKAISDSDGLCCLHCYGLAEIDWIEYANGIYKKRMINLKKMMKELFWINIYPFLHYVQYGEVCYDEDSENWFHYDPANDCWFKSTIILDSLEGHRAKNGWIEMFRTDGYCDIESVIKYKDNFPSGYLKSNYYYAAEIKANLIDSRAMTLDELYEIKEELKILGFSIEDLNWIKTDKIFERNMPRGFEFNWNSLLDKFYLPRHNKYTPVPHGVLTL